ncbi:MFS transporter [Xylophilus rhododendri]|uniref:MFS transporter n=1 Tax=Xylophilus rhododendri TaxID=2697032 RepID=A0A857J259_9BURK|nr:MFS transporter [Xylophilus rhododendri]
MSSQLARVIPIQVFIHSTMAGTRLAVPLLALQQGYSAASVGILVALFALTQVFLALPAGRFADRHGVRLPVTLAAIASCAGAGLAALLPVFPAFCVAALLTGGGTGVVVIALQRHVGRAATGAAQLKQAFSWLAIAPAVGNFIGPFCAGMLIDHAGATPSDLWGFRICFVVMALLPLLAWYLARDVTELASEPPSVDAEGKPNRAIDLLRAPMFRRLLFCNWLQSSSWDVHAFVVPLLGHERGLGASTIGTILGAFAIAAAAIRIVLPVLTAGRDERDVITVSTLSTAVLFAVYPLLPTALLMGLCSVLLGFALGAVQPMVMSMLHHITPPSRQGEALGLRLMFINASSVAVPIVFGAAGAVLGIGGIFWMVGGVVACGTRAVRGLERGRGMCSGCRIDVVCLLAEGWFSSAEGGAGAARPDRAHFLCFAKESKQRKATRLRESPSFGGGTLRCSQKRGPRQLASLKQVVALIRFCCAPHSPADGTRGAGAATASQGDGPSLRSASD